jgi:membrane associated rhomboid family serine protease
MYIVAGIAGGLAQVFSNPTSDVPSVGASGAIAGVLGAYIVLYPRAAVRTLLFLGPFITFPRVSAFIVIGLWFLIQLVSGITAIGDVSETGGGIAFWAHVGGFVAGMVLVFFFKKRDVDMLQPPQSRAFQSEGRRGPWG